jgi:hypothetical protein
MAAKGKGKTKKAPARAAAKRRVATRTAAARPKAAKKPRAALPAPASGVGGRTPRRAIFIDVENTSSEASLIEVLDALKIDRLVQPTQVTAVGNWRAVGQMMGRRLAALGAHLVHSAPARGVRDWSDLWLAVAAGCWLGQSEPGDVLEIVSNDRAFDAVGDEAAARGVVYRRVQHRRDGVLPAETVEPRPARRTRGGRRHRRRSDQAPATPASTAHVPHARPAVPHTRPAAVHAPEPELHGATRDQMVDVIERLTGGQAGRWVNLDILERALKAEGFSRPPGSPRLVTRLRRLKDVEVDSHGRVRVTVAEHAPAAHSAPEPAPAKDESPAPKRRRRRRKPSGESAASGAEEAL